MAQLPNIDVGLTKPQEISRMDSFHQDEGAVERRFLVTKARSMFATGATIKYIEVMKDGSVRIRDAKDSKSADWHYDPMNVFERGDINSVNVSMTNKNKKKREFKFSSLDEKNSFFDLIDKMAQSHAVGGKGNSALNSPIIGNYKVQKKTARKQRYTIEPFIKIPEEWDNPFIMKDCIIRRQGSEIDYYGKLVGLTNYRMIVKETFDEEHISATAVMNQARKNQPLKFSERDPIIPALEIHHSSVNDFVMDGDGTKVTIETKDFRTIIIDLQQVRDVTLKAQYIEMLRRHMTPTDDREVFAFKAYQSTLKKIEKSNPNGGGNSKNNQIFRELRKSRYDQAHRLQLMREEYRRIAGKQGLIDEMDEYKSGNSNNNSNQNNHSMFGSYINNTNNNSNSKAPYRLSYGNLHYDLCSTYPKILMVPTSVTDELLSNASKHRSRNRLPVITWANSYNVTIARCSQPTAGITNKKSEHDMKLLSKLNELNTYSDSYVICDCRPRINAIANALKGKGYEETSKSYAGSHIIFFDIQNIHQMRASITSLKKCCESQESEEWLATLSATKWFQHLSKILQCAKRVASMVDKDRYSVLVHCSDGWDRTAQICALSQLLLDPYYRKFEGFCILVQKEWLWFGHKFADRNGNYQGGKASSHGGKHSKDDSTADDTLKQSKKDERSPIFVQFLDTVYQVMRQFPWAFEFTHELLLEFATHVSSGRFGDFFGNCEQDRDQAELWIRTGSFFKYLKEIWSTRIYSNPGYVITRAVLRPRFAVKDIVLWDELYCRFSSHDKDRRLKLNASSASSSKFDLNNTNFHGHGGHGSEQMSAIDLNNILEDSDMKNGGANGYQFDVEPDVGADLGQMEHYRRRIQQLEALVKSYQNKSSPNSAVSTPRKPPPPKATSPGIKASTKPPPKKPQSKPPSALSYTKMGGNVV